MLRRLLALVVLTFSSPAFGQTATPISALPAASTLTGSEIVPVVQAAATRRTTTAAISSAGLPALPAAVSASGLSGVCVTPGVAGSTQLCTPAQIVAQAPLRQQQQSSTTIYVRTDGNDGCTGLVDAPYTSGTACAVATWQVGVNNILALDTGNFDAYVKAGSQSGVQTWNTSGVNILGPTVGHGRIHITGNGANTVINSTTNTLFFNGPLQGFVGNLTLTSSGGYASLLVGNGAWVGLDNPGPIFGAATGSHIMVHDNQSYFAALNTTYSITGNAGVSHIWVTSNGAAAIEGTTITITGSPSVSSFAQASVGGYIQIAASDVFSGTLTGSRYLAQQGGMIATANQGVNFLPGSTAGVEASGGMYTDLNDVTFSTVNALAYVKVGTNQHQIFDNGASDIGFGLASGGTVTAYAGIKKDSGTGATVYDGPGGSSGLGYSGILGLRVDSYGAHYLVNYLVNGAASTVGTCGSTPNISGTTNGGFFTTGTGTVTSCSVTFGQAFQTASYCTITPGASFSGTYYVTSTTTGLTANFSASSPSTRWNYHCDGS